MRKTMVIAGREFGAAVKTKAFLISLIVMPLMMFGGMVMQRAAGRLGDIKAKRIAVIDRTPGAPLAAALEAAAAHRNENQVIDKQTNRQTKPKITIERVEPVDVTNDDAVKRQRYELSERVRKDELFAFVELGSDLLDPTFNPSTLPSAELARRAADVKFWEMEDLSDEMLGDDKYRIRYTTNRPTNNDIRSFLNQSLQRVIWQQRMAAANLPFEKVMPLLRVPTLSSRGLSKLDAKSGAVVETPKENQFAAFMVPLVLIMLMFLIVMVGASPLTTNLVEEKQLKIAEVLLGSVNPFQLMMGKLIGGVGVALTLGAIYFIGAYVVARQFGVDDMVSVQVIAWFAVFMVIGVMMYGAMFVAAGAAVTNVKEAQSLLTPVILLIILPIFVLQNLLTDPSGTIARFGSFFPTTAPMVTVARLAIPPGIPLWETLVSAAVAILTTIAIVWAAGRIFRVGILMQGQGAKMGEMLKWVVRG